MNISINYNELQEVASARVGKDLTIERIEDDKCNVSLGISIPFIGQTMQVSLELTIERIEGNDVTVLIGGPQATGMALNIAIPMIAQKVGNDVIEKGEGGRVVLHLDRNERTRHIFNHLQLTAIKFLETAVNIGVQVKKE